MAHPVRALPVALSLGSLGLTALSVGCGARQEIHWVNDTTFVVSRMTIADQVKERYSATPTWRLRATAALDNNCPLERVVVLAERRLSGAPAHFIVRTCDDEQMYMEHGSDFVLVPRRAPARPNEKKEPPR